MYESELFVAGNRCKVHAAQVISRKWDRLYIRREPKSMASSSLLGVAREENTRLNEWQKKDGNLFLFVG